MCRKLFLLISIVLLLSLSLAGSVSAWSIDIRWDGGGDGTRWDDPNNWSPNGVPSVGYGWAIDVNDNYPNPAYDPCDPCSVPVITYVPHVLFDSAMTGSTAVGAIGEQRPDDLNDWVTFDMTGGYLHQSDTMWIGGSYGRGILNLSAGDINVTGGHGNFVVGQYGDSKGVVNITGGSMRCVYTLYVYLNESQVNLDGGVIKAPNLTIVSGCNIDIEGGALKLNDDVRDVISYYVGNGGITAYDGAGEVRVLYNPYEEIWAGYKGVTTITGILVDPNEASDPNPEYAASVNWDAAGITLSWTPGTYADKHNVYFGTSEADVNASATPVSSNQDGNSYGPVSVDLGGTYYWRIEEVNTGGYPGTPWYGQVWFFEVPDYLVIDNFEGYLDKYDMRGNIGERWDYGGYGNSSRCTLDIVTTPVYEGYKSLKYRYLTGTSPYIALGEYYLPANLQDWTVQDITRLDFRWIGEAGNADEEMYVAIEDVNGQVGEVASPYATSATKTTGWWSSFGYGVALEDFVTDNPNITLKNVKKLILGVGYDSALPNGTGNLYFDQIILTRSICTSNPAGDINGDCETNFKDLSVVAEDWLTTGFWPWP